MPFHHLIGNCVLATRSSISQVSHRKSVLFSLFSKTCAPSHRTCDQQYHGQVDVSRTCAVRSKSDLIVGSGQQLSALPSMTHLQTSMKFSSSAFLYSRQGDYTGSKQSLFDDLSLRSLTFTPAPYMLYGLGGLIPFVSAPVYMFMTSTYYPLLAHAQLVYGACILSFLGGVAWGNELKTPEMSNLKSLGYSISLPLIGWVGVLAHPSFIAFPIVISGIVFAGYTDLKIQCYPQWFKNLRFLLSSLVFISLITTFSFRLLYSDSRSKRRVE